MKRVAINDGSWQVLAPFLEKYAPRKHLLRDIVDGILWVLRTGSQWRYLPGDYPPKSTCYHWYRKLLRDGVFNDALAAITQLEEAKGRVSLEECSVDATFIRARATLDNKGKTKCGKGHKLMAIVDKKARPLALYLDSAQPHELKLLQPTIDALATDANPKFLLADGAYDSDPMDEHLVKQGINLVAPHRKNRKKPKTQDGRHFRRYRRRWKVEQLFALLHNYRKITNCYEKYSHTFFGFVQLAALILFVNKL
jgi:transposase